MTDANPKKRHRSLTTRLWLFSGGFFVFGFALVPLYSVLCNVTGYGDRTQLERAYAGTVDAPVTDRKVTVEFLSSTPTFGEWEFRPDVASMEVQPGRLYEAKFYAKNLRTQPVTAQAIPSIAPMEATQYFHKTECFCFTPQQFGAEEGRELVVRFILAPELPRNMDRVTLAYGMFTATKQQAAAGGSAQTSR
jgi:cytochrome c oxidase assembly protein subunit 11